MGGAFFGFLSSKLEFITKAIFSRYYNILENKDYIIALFLSVLSSLAFCFYYMVKDYEIVRVKISDLEFDLMQRIYSKQSLNLPSLPKIIVILVDLDYLNSKNLNDGYDNITANYTPRKVLADLLNDLNTAIADKKPKAILLDYYLAYTSNENNQTSKGDISLINTLNKMANKHTIYLPTLKNRLFLEDFNLSKNIKFSSTIIKTYQDDIARGFSPCFYKDENLIKHIALEFSDKNLTKCENLSQKELFEYRILFKSINELKQNNKSILASNYKNISIYSADILNRKTQKINSRIFDDAIVLIGSNYKASNDNYKTPVGQMSGVLVLANAINSQFITKDKMRQIGLFKGMIYYFFIGFFGIYLSIKLINLAYKGLQRELLWVSILQVATSIVFFIPATFLFFKHYVYIVWIIPWVLFQLLDTVLVFVKFIFEKDKKELFLKFAKVLICLVAIGLVMLALAYTLNFIFFRS